MAFRKGRFQIEDWVVVRQTDAIGDTDRWAPAETIAQIANCVLSMVSPMVSSTVSSLVCRQLWCHQFCSRQLHCGQFWSPILAFNSAIILDILLSLSPLILTSLWLLERAYEDIAVVGVESMFFDRFDDGADPWSYNCTNFLALNFTFTPLLGPAHNLCQTLLGSRSPLCKAAELWVLQR